jgi:hypothetical protein
VRLTNYQDFRHNRTMKQLTLDIFKYFTLIILYFSLSNCTKQSDETKIKTKLKSLAQEISFKKNLVPIRQVLKTKIIIENYFTRNVDIVLRIRKTKFNIPNAEVLSKRLFLLNKLIGKIDLQFNSIAIVKHNDSKGIFYIVDFEIYALGIDAQENQKIDEKISFQFYFRKEKDRFLIFRGRNTDLD